MCWMTERIIYHFKAATGFGAVVDGSVLSTSSGRVARELMLQGLIPVRIWSEQQLVKGFDLLVIPRAIGRWFGRHTSSKPARL